LVGLLVCLLAIKYFEFFYRGAVKSLARPARKHIRDALDFNNIETQTLVKFFYVKIRRRRKFTPF